MPVYRLTDEILFPPVEFAEPGGLLAIGGDLSPERLLAAYRKGIFPWYSAGEPILWWAPDPRFVLFPAELRVSRSMRQFLKKGVVQITFDKAFGAVISACGSRPRTCLNSLLIFSARLAKMSVYIDEAGYHEFAFRVDNLIAAC